MFETIWGDAARAEVLHQRLLEWQAKATSEMKTASHEIDVSEIIKDAENTSAAKLCPTHISMALGHSVLNPEELRKRVVRQMEEHPLVHMFGHP